MHTHIYVYIYMRLATEATCNRNAFLPFFARVFVRNSFNFVIRDFMNRYENHRENHWDFSQKKSEFFIQQIQIFIEKIINHTETAQIAASGFLSPQWRNRPNSTLLFLYIIKKLPKSLPVGFLNPQQRNRPNSSLQFLFYVPERPCSCDVYATCNAVRCCHWLIKMFWNWMGVVRFVSQEIWSDKEFCYLTLSSLLFFTNCVVVIT